MQGLTDENAGLKEHMKSIQDAFDKLKAMAEQQGIGKQMKKLMHESGLNAYLCRKVFTRLYEDAVHRIERRYRRSKKMLEEKEKEFRRTARDLNKEFAESNCVFMNIHRAKVGNRGPGGGAGAKEA